MRNENELCGIMFVAKHTHTAYRFSVSCYHPFFLVYTFPNICESNFRSLNRI